MNTVQDETTDTPTHPVEPGGSGTHRGGDGPDRAATSARSDAADPVEREARAAFERARRGQRAAYGTVVRLYHDRLYNAVYRLVHHHDDAAEVTQEAFAKGFEKLDDFRGDSGPYTWLFRIAMNAAVSRIRRGRRRKTLSLEQLAEGGAWQTSYGGGGGREGRSFADELPGSGPSPHEHAETSEDHRAVVEALGRLDAEYRVLLVMRDLEGFDYRQMAEMLQMPMGTLKSRLFRARVALREMLQDHFEARRRRGDNA